MVSILAFDVGENGARIDAYDAVVGGNLLGSDSFVGTSFGAGQFADLSVAAPGIRRFELYQLTNVPNDSVLFDNLTFTPEPSSLLMLGLGLLTLLG